MNHKFPILLAAGGMIALATWQGAHLMEPSRPEKISVPDGGTTVPMLDVGGRPMVEVRINGKGPYPFIMDTGADETDVESSLIDELALPGTTAAMFTGGARIEELAVGNAVLRGVTVARARMLGGLGGANPPRGVLSASYFPGCLVVLDYPAKKIAIRQGSLPPADDRRVFQYTAADILPRAPVRIAGLEFRVHVDSGSPAGLTVPIKYSEQIPLTDKPKELAHFRTPDGEFPVLAATVNGPITLGEYKLEIAQLNFSDVKPGPGPAVGNMGYQILRDFIVTLDSMNHRLQFEH
jgi:hypothetical protein